VAALGTFALALALGLAVYGLVASILGARTGRPLLVESARTTAYSLFALVAAANGAMLAAILADDFSLRYVAENSSRTTPTFFKVLSLWSADAGSLLLWNLVLAGFIAAVAFRLRTRRPEAFPWVMAVLFGVAAFYLLLVSGPTRPFATLAAVPLDGRGPLPLLQNHPLMAAHPPFLYLGFIAFTVPFAFAIASLLSRDASDGWVRRARPWMLTGWIFLTVGLVLGALWSYGVLGWGGYWAWDPVENVALLPWLAATAFLHSVVVQERRGMLPIWNLSLVVATFALTTFGTFLTRGSILSSVHTFAQTLVGPLYLAFLLVVIAGGFGLIAARAWRMRSEGRIDSVLSRESAFVGNNLGLVTVTLVVLLGTIFPLAVEAVTGRQTTVGEPYFVQTVAPLFLLLLFLMGVGPLLPWRRAGRDEVARRLRVPAVSGALVIVALVAAGMRNVAAILAFGLAAFAGTANVGVLARGMRSGRRSGVGALGAIVRNRRLYGGTIVHLGIAIAAVAVTASSSFALDREVALEPGDTAAFAGYELRYEGRRLVDEPHRDVVIADVSVRRDGEPVGRLSPSLNLYPGGNEPIGTPSIRYGVLRDLYASLLGFTGGGERASFRLFLNPGVTWLWVGGAIAALGGLLAAWPSGRRRRGAEPAAPAVLKQRVEVPAP